MQSAKSTRSWTAQAVTWYRSQTDLLSSHPLNRSLDLSVRLARSGGSDLAQRRIARRQRNDPDIIAHKDELGFEPPIIKVQVKSTEGSIGDLVVSALYGKVATSEFGLLVTLGSFTHQAITFGKSKNNLRLVDGNELVNLVLEHYEQFDSRYKGLLPLRKAYVPEALNEE